MSEGIGEYLSRALDLVPNDIYETLEECQGLDLCHGYSLYRYSKDNTGQIVVIDRDRISVLVVLQDGDKLLFEEL